MQPYLFPYIGYWQLINAVDTFVIYDDVNFIKKGHINRNLILSGGDEKRFTLELEGASQNKLINEINIGNSSQKLLKTFEFSYRKAPFFDNIFPMLSNILSQDEKNLAKFIALSLETISLYLNIETTLIYSSIIKKNNTLKAQDKIIDICKELNAARYINAVGGQNLYDKKMFEEHSIGLNFIETMPFEYKQFKNQFVPNLSIIDILMFNEVKDIKYMLNNFRLT